ncbi:hypothetical protein [Sphingobacterium zeae]|uniref:hypothetical protein n=1 Tax=Sphingobacterium zeae TaxID=1776859 RepID=UPI003616925E
MSITSIKEQLNITESVINYLKSKQFFTDHEDEVFFVSGKDQRPSNTKLILVNTLFAMKDDDTGVIDGYLNVNIQDTDNLWIEYLSELINLFLDQSLVDGFKIEYTTEHLFKVSEDLFFKNLKFKFSK